MSEELTLEGRFLSAAELKLTEKQHCGLLKTLALLEAGEIKRGNNEHTRGFNMGTWGGECGSVCCLGGTAEAIMGEKIFHDKGGGYWHPALRPNTGRAAFCPELHRLFFPGPCVSNPYNATPRQAAIALRGYLETGKTDWDNAMRGGRK